MGEIDGDGYLKITGRKKDIIITAGGKNITPANLEAEIKASIMAHVDQINEKFARVEQVKKIKILPADLSQEGGELTPTLKVKRNVVADKYAADIESLYTD